MDNKIKIKKVIGIISCKGGVGKSTLSINLSSMLSAFFFKKIGLLDADIHGSSHAQFLGLSNKLNINLKDKELIPFKKYNIKTMSLSYFLNKTVPVLLRGPMISNTLNYLYNNTKWGDLDILFIDFPPGTGDIYLSMLRDIEIYGAFLVTTPNLLSIDSIKKSFLMLKKFNVKILGILENMNTYVCNKCGNKNQIYKNFVKYNDFFDNLNLSNIFELPFNPIINKSSNDGIPFVFYESCYKEILILKKMCKKII